MSAWTLRITTAGNTTLYAVFLDHFEQGASIYISRCHELSRSHCSHLAPHYHLSLPRVVCWSSQCSNTSSRGIYGGPWRGSANSREHSANRHASRGHHPLIEAVLPLLTNFPPVVRTCICRRQGPNEGRLADYQSNTLVYHVTIRLSIFRTHARSLARLLQLINCCWGE